MIFSGKKKKREGLVSFITWVIQAIQGVHCAQDLKNLCLNMTPSQPRFPLKYYLHSKSSNKSRTPRGEISWNQVEIMRHQSRFPWNQARKSAQPSSPTHFYNVWRHFLGKSRGNQREIRKSSAPKLLVTDPSFYMLGIPIENYRQDRCKDKWCEPIGCLSLLSVCSSGLTQWIMQHGSLLVLVMHG